MRGLVSLPLIVKLDHQACPLGILENAIVMTGVGGLGMALGSALYPSAYRGFLLRRLPAQSFLNGSTLSMIFFCFIGCRLCGRSCDRKIFANFFETGSCMQTVIAGMFLGELFLTSLADDGVCRSALSSVNTHFCVLNYSDGVDRVCVENQCQFHG